MDLLLFGITIGTTGKILLGVTVILVHHKIVLEHKIDRSVIKEMKRESIIAYFAIALITLGYLAEITAFGYLSHIIGF